MLLRLYISLWFINAPYFSKWSFIAICCYKHARQGASYFLKYRCCFFTYLFTYLLSFLLQSDHEKRVLITEHFYALCKNYGKPVIFLNTDKSILILSAFLFCLKWAGARSGSLVTPVTSYLNKVLTCGHETKLDSLKPEVK